MHQERPEVEPQPAVSGGRRATISFHSLGCKANQEEMECLVSRLGAAGFMVVPFGERADWVVVNTCTVTSAADSDSRQAVRAAVRSAAGGRVVATGCFAQRDPAAVAAIAGVTWVVGNAEKSNLAHSILGESAGGNETAGRDDSVAIAVSLDPTLTVFAEYGDARAGRRRRATLKVQDGCDEHCTFCVIPAVRGRSRSRGLPEVLREAVMLARSGYREIALTGINTALWGRDLPSQPELPDLLDALARIPGLARVRLNSLEPQYVKDAWLERFASCAAVCRHFHLPLQSGDAAVLHRMNRRYSPDAYARLIDAIHARIPDAAVGCDVMVGFPGESARDFDATARFLEALPLAYVHVFTYSERPGTPAPRLQLRVPDAEKRRRSVALRDLAAEIRVRYARSQVGTRQEVLLEAPASEGCWQGLTGNYLRVRLPWRASRAPEPGRTLRTVLLTGVGNDGVMNGFADGDQAGERGRAE